MAVSATLPRARRIWLYPLVLLFHVVEEINGVGIVHGINLSLAHFFMLVSLGWLLIIAGILLSSRLGFPQLLEIFLATLFVANGLSHIANSIYFASYDSGVITGTLLMIPLGLVSLISLRNSMRRLRYFAGIGLGLVAQVVISALAW